MNRKRKQLAAQHVNREQPDATLLGARGGLLPLSQHHYGRLRGGGWVGGVCVCVGGVCRAGGGGGGG